MGRDDTLTLIEQTRAWLAAQSAREPVARQPERRRQERRGLGFTTRRSAERERSVHVRQFLLSYLRRLPAAELWQWIDGLWLGQATDPRLAALLECAAESDASKNRTGGLRPRPVGRPKADRLVAGVDPIHNASLRLQWRRLTEQLTTLSRARRQFHAPMNRTRAGRPRSTDLRDSSRQTAIGERLDSVGLFMVFFDATNETPQEMAAQVLRRELDADLTLLEVDFRSQAARTLSDQRRDLLIAKAEEAANRRKRLPAWRTLYNNLRRRRD